MPDSIRHVRVLFGCAAFINILFFGNDARFFGHPHFYVAMAARTTIVVVSLACFFAVRKGATCRDLQRLCLAWAVPVIAASGPLVSPHTDVALLIIFVLPTLFYLALPLPFRWTMALGSAFSVVGLAWYLLPGPWPATGFGLILGMVTLNVILILVLGQSTRLRHQEWATNRILRAVNRDLSEHREMLRSLLKAAPAPLIITAREDGRLIQANDAAYRYFGEGLSGSVQALENCLDRRDRVRLIKALQSNGHVPEFETRVRLADGSVRDVLLAATTAVAGGTEAILTIVVDITHRKEMEARLERLATTDPLTGLTNRTRLFTLAAAEIERGRRRDRSLAVIMIDIDLFKRINDTFGHQAGDCALKAFADLCQSLVRRHDIVGRVGGEEFAVLLPESDRTDALALAERLRVAVEGLRLDALPVAITISAGVSEVLPGENALDGALSRADRALYAAKNAGRNQVVLYDGTGPVAAAGGR